MPSKYQIGKFFKLVKNYEKASEPQINYNNYPFIQIDNQYMRIYEDKKEFEQDLAYHSLKEK